MRAITRFEDFLETVVEGSFRRLFRGRLEPVDLARRLGRVMDDNKRATWQRPLVPNQYRIALSSADFAEVRSFVEALERELGAFAAERAAERGYSLLAPAAVTIAEEAALPPGAFQVTASLVDSRAGAPAPPREDHGQTRAMRPLEMPAGPTGYLVGEVGGRRRTWPLASPRVLIGRGLDNDVVLDDASVSRHHAELSREGGRVEIRDLGSTNGTWVNAGRVRVAAVHPGDQLALGAVQLELTRRPAG
jgi:hypothetical protein